MIVDHRSNPELLASCDILIIGGGYAEITVAYYLLCNEDTKTDPKPSVVLPEAQQACSGAAARNGVSTSSSSPQNSKFFCFATSIPHY